MLDLLSTPERASVDQRREVRLTRMESLLKRNDRAVWPRAVLFYLLAGLFLSTCVVVYADAISLEVLPPGHPYFPIILLGNALSAASFAERELEQDSPLVFMSVAAILSVVVALIWIEMWLRISLPL